MPEVSCRVFTPTDTPVVGGSSFLAVSSSLCPPRAPQGHRSGDRDPCAVPWCAMPVPCRAVPGCGCLRASSRQCRTRDLCWVGARSQRREVGQEKWKGERAGTQGQAEGTALSPGITSAIRPRPAFGVPGEASGHGAAACSGYWRTGSAQPQSWPRLEKSHVRRKLVGHRGPSPPQLPPASRQGADGGNVSARSHLGLLWAVVGWAQLCRCGQGSPGPDQSPWPGRRDAQWGLRAEML